MDVREIVSRWIGENGADGLISQDLSCSCTVADGDLMRCRCGASCMPAVEVVYSNDFEGRRTQ